MKIKEIFQRSRGHPAAARQPAAVMLRGVTLDDKPWCPVGYTRLSDVPEIKAGIRKIAELMSVMPLHLMQNTDQGNIRVNNELSRKLDITPCRYLSRPQWIYKIVTEMLTDGNSFGIPIYDGDYLDEIVPVNTGGVVESLPTGGYDVMINGRIYGPDEILHFSYNPDPTVPWNGLGLTADLRALITAIAQAHKTALSIMERPMPSIIIRADNLSEELKTQEGRAKLYERYIESQDAGHPWILSADNFDVQQIKPMSINDLAIKDDIEISERTAAAILGVPPYVLGVDKFDQAAYNNFVSTKLQPIAVLIEQELTRKLLWSPTLFFRFSNRQLYSYTMEERLKFSTALHDRGILSGNEVRIDFDFDPVDGLDERKVLENYIPIDMSGKQNKLNGGGE